MLLVWGVEPQIILSKFSGSCLLFTAKPWYLLFVWVNNTNIFEILSFFLSCLGKMENNHWDVASNRFQNQVVLFKIAETFVPSILNLLCMYIFHVYIYFLWHFKQWCYMLYTALKRGMKWNTLPNQWLLLSLVFISLSSFLVSELLPFTCSHMLHVHTHTSEWSVLFKSQVR